MNGPFQVAQANIAGQTAAKPPARIVKIAKPFTDQSVVVALSYDGSVKADLSAIAGEKITLVHIGEKLIILFDNKSTVTLEPFFDSTGKPLDSLTVEVSPGRNLTGAEFAALFPVTEDQSVLPAAGDGNGNAQASGANFTSVGVDPLALPGPLDLLGQEELPNFVITNLLTPAVTDADLIPSQITGARVGGVTEEEQLGGFVGEGPSVQQLLIQLNAIGSGGKEDPNDVTLPNSDGTASDGLDQDTPDDSSVTTQFFHGDGANALTNLVASGNPPLTFTIDATIPNSAVVDGTGAVVKSAGHELHYSAIDTSVAGDNTIVGGYSEGEGGFHEVFRLTIHADGTYDFELLDKIDHPVHTTDAGSTSNGHLEETLFLDFTTLVHVADLDGENFTLTGTGAFTIGVIDDTPEVSVSAADAKPLSLVSLDESIGLDAGDVNAASDDVAGNTVPDPLGVNAIGEVKSDTGALANLFSVTGTTGEDGFGSVDFAFTLTLGGAGQNGGVATSLSVTDPNHVYGNDSKIYLFNEGGEIVGRVGSAQGAIALRISIDGSGGSDPATAQLIVDQYLPVNHGADGNNFDSSLPLTLVGDGTLGVTLTTTVTDGDGDVATSAATVTVIDSETTPINIEDDGPTIAAGEGGETTPLAVLDLDETIGADRYNTGETESNGGASNGADDKAATVTVSVAPLQAQAIGELSTGTGALAGLFTAANVDFGTDGPAAGGGKTYELSLVLSSEAVGTSLTATGLVGTPLAGMTSGQRAIELVQVNATTIEGRLVGDGIAANGDEYVAFRITLENPNDPATAKITVDQFLAIDHGGSENPSVFDEQTLLTLVGGALDLKLVTTVTDGDSDHASLPVQVNLIGNENSFIAFDDDGPKPLSISAANGAANGLFFDGFVPNNNAWGAGSGINNSGTAGAWHIATSPYEGASTIQLERVGDNYRGSDSPTNSVMVDLEATPGNVQVSQDLTLTPGAVYHLTFEIGAANDPGITDSAKLEVFWNGASVGIYTPASGVMQTISIDVTAAGANNQLTFREIGEAGDNTGTFLANVKLSDVIIIDETKGVDADSDDTTGLGALFATVTNGGPVGVDPDMDQPQYAQGLHSVVVLGTADYGTDGAAATNPIQIGLSVSSAGVDSGLTTTEGKAIHLFVEGALVVGRFDSGNDGTYDTAAFALSIDPNGGILSIAQYVSLHHPDITSNDEGVYLANGSLLATVTLTDGDGDRTTTSADISSAVRFEDDGPSIDPLQSSSLRDWTIDEDVLPAAGHSTPHGNDALDTPADTNDYTQINDKPLGVTWGADGPKALTFAATDSQHPTITVTDQNGNPQPALTSGGVALVYSITTNADGGQTLVAYKGSVSPANEVFTLTLDPDTGTSGTFSFELTGALDHPIADGQNTLNLRFGFTATDGDGDTATSFLTMRITDDVPYASNTVISRRVDEDDIDTPWSQGTSQNDGDADGSITENSTGAAFISGTLAGLVAPGADLPGKFAFSSTAVAQLTALGLFSKESALGNGENGKPLGYVISNGPVGSNEIVITGNEPNPQGNPVFSLTLNTVTGAYEFRLFDELIHMPGNGQNDDLRSGQPSGSPLVQQSIPYLDLGSIITYTDKDGDTVNLGGKFTVTITDDVPHADIDIGRGSVTVDETPGNQADDTTSSNVRNLFAALEATFVSGVRLVGDDPDVSGDNNGGNSGNGAIAYAHSNFAIVTDDSTIGSDSPPYPHQYALSIVGGAASGLFVTDGNPINLSVNADGLVIGTVGGNPAGEFYGKVAFAIAIESDGEVSVAQYLSLKHDDRGDSNETNDNGTGGGNDASPDDTPNPVQQTLDGKILVTLTVTDSDGDKSTDTANIGNLITFLDDGPSLHSNDTVSLEDDDLPGGNEGGPGDDSAPDDETGTLSHNYGADGAGSTLLTGVNLPSGQGFTSSVSLDGLTLIIKQNGVDVLKITLSDSTDGDYTVTQLHAIDHPTQNGQNGDDTENNAEFTVSYRVTDGDGDFTDGSLKINVDDDTPEPNFVLQSGKLVVIDETAGLQNATATPGVTGDSNDNDTSNPFPVAVTNPGVPAADSTLFGAPQVAQSNGAVVAVTPHYGADGPGNIAFTIDVPGGSSASSGLTTVSGQPITLFEVNANLVVGRYDGPDGGSGVGTSDPAAFAIHIDPATGVISVVQYVAIKHDDRGDFDENNDDGSNGNDALSNDSPDPVQQSIINSAIRVTATVTDHDGDSVDEQFEIGSKIVFEDDGPTISITATSEAGVVLTTQDADTIGAATDTAISAANFSGVFATTSSYGADGGGSTTLGYSLAVTGPVVSGRVDSNLDSQGASIYLYNVGGTIVGSTALTAGAIADGNKIFSVSVNGSGVVTLTQFQQIDHPIANDPSASGSPFDDQNAVLGNGLISLTRSGSITDGDGDTATSSATIDLGGNIQFTDHGPSATTTASLKVDEDDLSAGNHDTTSPGDDTASASLSGTLGFTPGADSPATVSFSPLGGTAVVDANGQPVTAGGVALTYLWVGGATNTLYASTNGTVGGAVFKIEVTNPSTGAYSFSLLGPVDHPGHDDPGVAGTQTAFEDNININLTYTVTDFDKDTATGTLAISIDDDMPIIGASPAPTNLILNGSFEDHGPVGNPGFNTFTAINHWTSGPDSVPFEIQQGNIGDLLPQEGNAKVELDSDPINNPTSQLNATIQQTISTPLAAGDSYELSFWYSPRPNDGNADSSSLKVYWNGVVVHTIDSSTQADGWQHVSVIVTAQAGSNTVAFQGSGQPNQLGAYLDNVSLVPAITVDEDGLTGPLAFGNHDSQPGDNVVPNTEGAGVDNNEATATGKLNIQWGADNIDSGVDGVSGPFNSFVQDPQNGVGDRSVTFTNANVAVTGVPALYSHGDLVTFELNPDHTVLSGKANGRTVFEVSLTDEGTGQFRFVLLDKLDHAPGNNENDIGLSFNFTATDSDGDAVSGTFVVGVDDDVPVASATAHVTATVDEDGLQGANLDGNPLRAGETDGSENATFTGNAGALNSLVNFGADGPGSFGLAVQTPAIVSGLFSKTEQVWIISNGSTLTGYVESGNGSGFSVGDREIFTLTVGANGSYVFTLKDQVDHPTQNGQNGDDSENLLAGSGIDLSSFVIATDGDGDPVALAAGSFTVQVLDDIPVVTAKPPEMMTETTQYSLDGVSGGNDLYKVLNGDGDKDILLSARTGNNPDTVNTSNDIGVGQGQNINGKDNNSVEEYLRIDFVHHGVTAGNNNSTTFTATDHYSASSLTFKVPQVQQGPASLFLQLSSVPAGEDNNSATANLDNNAFVAISGVTVNGVAAALTSVYAANGTTLIGYLLEGVGQDDVIDVTGATSFGRLIIANYDGVTINTGGLNTEVVDGAKSFSVLISETDTLVLKPFEVRHDETTAPVLVNDTPDPNDADDTALAMPSLLSTRIAGLSLTEIGHAVGPNSLASLFTFSVGADEPPAVAYQLSTATTNGTFNGVDSGLKTTVGGLSILLYSDPTNPQILWGVTGADFASGTKVFAAYADPDGHLWLVQFQAIAHDLDGNTAAAYDDIAFVTLGLVHVTANLTDADGDTAAVVSETPIKLSFQDDGPLAVNDIDSANGATLTATGNVITGADIAINPDANITDGVADKIGTDGAKITQVQGFAGTDTTTTAGNFVINGQYGTLTLNENGNYSYVRFNGAPVVANDVFTYRLTDGDGDYSTATLTVSITDRGVSISGINAEGGDVSVNEAALSQTRGSGESDGTNPNTPALTQTGTFTVSAPDGVANLTIDGHVIVNNGVFTATSFATALGNTLAVTAFDGVTVSYSYTLLDNEQHAAVQGTNPLPENLPVSVTDVDGDTASSTLAIRVIDDVPTAGDNTYGPTITAPIVLTGLFGNDVFGADGVDTTNTIPGSVTATNGAHGTVVYNNNGTFTYTPDAGYSGSDSFTYTIKDRDGDVSTATVTLSSVITNTIPTAGEASAVVDDEGLTGGIDGNGVSTGDVTGNAFTASGVLPHSFVNDGPATNDPINFSLANNVAGFVGTEAVTYHWNDVTNKLTATSVGRGDIFEVVVDGGVDNGNGNYVFTLLQPVLHAAGDGENDATIVLNYQVVDGTTPADTATGTLTVTIDDDTPITTALADSVSVNEGNLPSDRNPVEANPVGIAQSDTGFLHINWGADNGSAKHLEFAKDGSSNPIGPSLTADGVPLLYVIRAPGDSAGNEQIVAYKQGDDPDTNPVFSITLYEGGNGYYTYVQYQNIDHNGVGTDSKTFGFTINAFDADGDAVSQTLTINVTDDVPTAYSNTNSVIEGGIVGGNVLTDGTDDVFGADGAILTVPAGGVVGVRAAGVDLTTAVLTGTGTQITGSWGKLTLNADGTYSYDGNPNVVPPAGASDVFVYTIKDGDGDTSTTTLTISLTDSAITASNDDVMVNEAALPVIGSTPASLAETVTGTVTDNVGGGIGPFTYALVGSGTGSHGTLTFNLDGSYSYTLTSPVTGPQADNSTNTANNVETFTYNVTDANGNTATNTITIDVIDDVPHANLNTGSVTEGGLLTVNAAGGVLTNDTAGADGYAAGGGVVGVRAAGLVPDTTTAVTTGVNTNITGQHGTLHLNADGSYTYQSTADNITSDTTDVFVYTIKDGDGDLSTTTLTINLANVTLIAPTDSDVTVYEKALDTAVTAPDIAAGTVTGSLPISPLETDATTNQLNGSGGVGTLHYALVTGGNAATAGTYGTIVVNDDGSYVYTLTKPFDTNPEANNSTNTEVAESFSYKVTDANGNTSTGTITVNIVDDVPTVAIDNSGPADPTTVAEAGTITGDWSLTPGADGVLPADFKVSIDGGAAAAVSVGTGINTGKGLLTFNANGSWTFVAATNLDNDVAQSVTFTLSAKDGDGDTSTDSHTISVTDGTKPSLSGGGLSLQMDDQNLSDGSTPANPDFATGTVSFTAGSDALTNFAFAAGTGALAGGLTWNRVSDILIEGWDGAVGTGTKIVALTLTPPGSIAVGATGSVTVTATLVNNYDSHPGINLDDLAALGSIGVVASDHDSDSVTQTVTLSVSDDLPVLNIVDTPATVNEGQTINGTWTLAPGADGVTSVDVTVNATTQSLSLTPSTNVVTFNLATGTLTVDADLQWHFTANSVTSNQQVTFSIKATDGDNDTSSDSQTITIQNVIQPLVIAGAVTGVVEEEHALPGGIDDTTSGTTPNLDTDVVGNLDNVTNAISGSFSTLVTGGIDGTLSYSFASLSGNPAVNTVANGPLTSDGKPVLFAMDGVNLIGYVNSDGGTDAYSSATDTKIFTVTLNSTSGAYSFTLNARVDHPIHNDSTEDAIAINLNGRVTVTDSGGPAPGDTNVPLNASITVIDDTPVAVSESASVNEGQKPTMNVVFVIDTSGSMGSGAGSRMELAKSAAITLLNNNSVDFNQIMVVSFASGASHNTPIWADKADAISYISGLSADGNTDYDAALSRVTTNWGSGPTAADQTVVYFISDGEPTDDNGTGTVGIVGAEQTAWETFLASKGVAASYAVGISTGVNDADLTPIAWAPGNPGLPPVIITSAGDLSTTLTGSLPGSVSGNVLANGDGFGADTGHIKTITVNGTTYTFDGNATITTSGNAPGAGDVINANGKQITIITDLGGKLVFNFAANGTNQAGEWDYTAPSNIPATSPENFAYTLTDDDGDTVGATLSLTVNNVNAAPSITSNGGGATAAINVAENSTAVTTVAATDPDAGTTLAYSISGGADAAKFAINGTTGALTFIAAPNFESPTDSGGNNVYDVTVQVTDGALIDTQAIAVTVTNANEAPTATNMTSTASYTEGAASVPLTNIVVSDIDVGDTITATLTLSNVAAGVLTTSGAATYNSTTGIWAITGTVAAVNTALAAVAFTPATNNDLDVTITTHVQDAGNLGPADGTITLDVTPVNNDVPVITSNGGGATAAISVAENSTAVTTVTAIDPDTGSTLTYSIIGGNDQTKFAINASTGVLTFVTAPNAESPTDNGANNVYNVTVQVSDGVLTDTQAIAVTVTDVNEFAPAITSSATASVAENTAATTTVYTATATDADAAAAITYSITGADAALFNINATNGQVRFNTSPNFEAPGDAGSNNVYDIVVHANDGTNDTTKAVAISVTNVNEAPVAQADSVITNIADPNNSNSETISIPISALLFNDSDPEGLPLAITSVSESESNFSVSINGTEIDVVDRTGGGTFTYTLNTTPAGATDTADVTIDRGQQGQPQLDGTAANEILIGRDGAADTLVGGGGIDFLVGGTGADHFHLNAPSEGGDHILDFSLAEGDSIDVLLAGFAGAGLAVGSPTAAQFGSSTTDTFGSASERFHFNTATHTLLYDADGTGGGSAATVLAILDNGVNIAATNIHIV